MLRKARNPGAAEPSYRVRGTSMPAAGERVGVEHGPGCRLGVGVPDLPSLSRPVVQADFADEPDDPVELEDEVEDAAVEAPASLFDPEPVVVVPFDEPVDSEDPEDDSAEAFSGDDPDPARASLR
jgi:hypothetical protein